MPARLKTAEWLALPGIQAVFDAVEQEGDAARAVGGAVRNTLLERPVHDVDIATTALPEVIVDRAKRAGLKAVPTGIDHGTVTVISDGFGYEVTTLRADVETFGRQAKVRFGRSWEEDARRRDFTMNALYCDRSGEIFDPLDGLPDCLSGRVRFIGDPNQRIREDYLRILRFFRIHGMYGNGEPDRAGLLACVQEREGLRSLSAERIGMEMKRLVTAPLAARCVELMENHGLLEIVTGGVARLVDFKAFRDLSGVADEVNQAPLAFAALAGFIDEDMDRLADRFRMSNAERNRMHCSLSAMKSVSTLAGTATDTDVRRLLFHHGRQGAVDGTLLAWAVQEHGSDPAFYPGLLERLRKFSVPVFPLKGKDLIDAGLRPGPEIGHQLKFLQSRWEASGYQLGRAELMGDLKQ
ncbi:CCA tRNA nucleotidyltransferase [Roseibium sp.]|uniref:CCA tRNA nucleotidyltransferase n=1 Tax=Roseibium sp. TaxID=1936156 RepID=UPI003A969FE4